VTTYKDGARLPVVCDSCRALLVRRGDDVVCPNGHPSAVIPGVFAPRVPVATRPTKPGFVCLWDGTRNLAEES